MGKKIKGKREFNIEDELIARDKAQSKFLKVQSEKNEYLGEYKERVIIALTKDQLIRDDLYPEVIEIIKKDKDAYLLKMTREVPLHNVKPYIDAAEEIGIHYTLVDGLSYKGEIGLVLVAKDALLKQKEDVIPESINSDFIDMGMENYLEFIGEKICSICREELLEKLPERKKDFKTMTIGDTIIGRHCPICGKRRK